MSYFRFRKIAVSAIPKNFLSYQCLTPSKLSVTIAATMQLLPLRHSNASLVAVAIALLARVA
jgi:hypothetical protein